MRRWGLTLVVLVAVTALMFLPMLPRSESGSSTETSTIKDYQATFTVRPSGDLSVTETLRVDFPLSRHGIFRFFDLADPTDPGARLVPEDIEVTRNGNPERFELSHEGVGRFVVARIGSPNFTIFGEHTYEISYRIPGAIGTATDAGSRNRAQFYWNLIPGGWQMPIERSELSVELPAAFGEVRCALGTGSTSGCRVTESGDGFTVTTGRLAPQTPVTVQTQLDMAPPGRTNLPWAIRFDGVFGNSLITLFVGLGLALLGVVAGLLVRRLVTEKDPAFPLQYAPPEGIGPAQAAYLLTERVPDRLLSASLLQLGAMGLVTIDRQSKGRWEITGHDGPDWAALDPVTKTVADGFRIGPGQSFALRPSSSTQGKMLMGLRKTFKSQVRGWGTDSGLLRQHSFVGLVFFAMGASLLVMLASFLPVWFGASIIGLGFGWFVVLAAPALRAGSSTVRTPTGRDLWSRVGGFHRVLATPSSEARFDFSGKQELYTAYIPWAVAFGCADVWADKYRMEMAAEPPLPAFFVGDTSSWTTVSSQAATEFTHSFTGSVDSAISAYTASQVSSGGGGSSGFSSGGGGGFSGGGGGGGGGGGSW